MTHSHLLAAAGSGPPSLGSFLLLPALVGAYFAPSVVALVRKVRHVGSVIVLNLCLGWTVVGWVVALAMACRSMRPEAPQVPGVFPPGWQPGPGGQWLPQEPPGPGRPS